MGIFCEINLYNPSDKIYQPGQQISGVIRYVLDKPIDIEKITSSLKGQGDLNIEIVRPKGIVENYTSQETYVNMQYVIQDVKTKMPTGSYEVKFNFTIPDNIPSTTAIKRNFAHYYVSGKIKYFLRIHFETSGFFNFNKKFRKEITIRSPGIATLLMEPLIYEENKKLTRFFSSKPCVVSIKTTIINSVIPIGGKIKAHCEVENNSNVLVKSVLAKLVEVYDFNAKGHCETATEVVSGTEFKTRSITSGVTQKIPIEIEIPCDRHSLDYSHIITRRYVLKIIAALPIPHRNVVLNIPVQIGTVSENMCGYRDDNANEYFSFDDLPPPYWEVMGEITKDHDSTCGKT